MTECASISWPMLCYQLPQACLWYSRHVTFCCHVNGFHKQFKFTQGKYRYTWKELIIISNVFLVIFNHSKPIPQHDKNLIIVCLMFWKSHVVQTNVCHWFSSPFDQPLDACAVHIYGTCFSFHPVTIPCVLLFTSGSEISVPPFLLHFCSIKLCSYSNALSCVEIRSGDCRSRA